jgi:hypothetical protein
LRWRIPALLITTSTVPKRWIVAAGALDVGIDGQVGFQDECVVVAGKLSGEVEVIVGDTGRGPGEVGGGDLGAFLEEPAHVLPAHAARRAGDEYDFAFQRHRGLSLSRSVGALSGR